MLFMFSWNKCLQLDMIKKAEWREGRIREHRTNPLPWRSKFSERDCYHLLDSCAMTGVMCALQVIPSQLNAGSKVMLLYLSSSASLLRFHYISLPTFYAWFIALQWRLRQVGEGKAPSQSSHGIIFVSVLF